MIYINLLHNSKIQLFMYGNLENEINFLDKWIKNIISENND